MKIIYYRTLLTQDNGLTYVGRMVYSFLVSKSITDCGFLFDSDGLTVNQDSLLETISLDGDLEMTETNNCKIARELGITRRSVINAKNTLRAQGFISPDDQHIVFDMDLLEHGYFELVGKNQLKGGLLIFYSFLLNKSAKYDYCIDTYRQKLAEEFGESIDTIKKFLQQLHKQKLTERLKNGKLKINKLKN